MLELVALPFVVLALLASTIGGVRVVKHVRYQRCLANIARLEIDLGYRPTPRSAMMDAQERWTRGVRGSW